MLRALSLPVIECDIGSLGPLSTNCNFVGKFSVPSWKWCCLCSPWGMRSSGLEKWDRSGGLHQLLLIFASHFVTWSWIISWNKYQGDCLCFPINIFGVMSIHKTGIYFPENLFYQMKIWVCMLEKKQSKLSLSVFSFTSLLKSFLIFWLFTLNLIYQK